MINVATRSPCRHMPETKRLTFTGPCLAKRMCNLSLCLSFFFGGSWAAAAREGEEEIVVGARGCDGGGLIMLLKLSTTTASYPAPLHLTFEASLSIDYESDRCVAVR